MSDLVKSGKAIALASVAGVLLLLQLTLLTAMLDFVTSFMLIGVGFAAGRMTTK
jgi:hypothetical protein